jgi:hypothetical protein
VFRHIQGFSVLNRNTISALPAALLMHIRLAILTPSNLATASPGLPSWRRYTLVLAVILNDQRDGQALSADFTGQGWSDYLHIFGIPIIMHRVAGARMAQTNLFGAQHHHQRFLQARGKTNPGSALNLTRVTPAIIDFLS